MDRRVYALVAVVFGLALGIIGNVLFYNRMLGLSVPLYVLLLTAALFAFKQITGQATLRRNLWLFVPLIFFAVMVAVRADETITFLNLAAVLALTMLIAHYFPLANAFDRDPLAAHLIALIETGVTTVFMPVDQLIQSGRWFRQNRPLRAHGVSSVARGLLLAVPIVFVFGVLLASADEVFAQYINQVTALFQFRGVEALFEQSVIVGFFAWFACGGLAYAVLKRPTARYVQVGDQAAQELPAEEEAPAAPKGKKRAFTLNLVEAGIVLGSVVGLFGVFVLIQFAYFFGGQSNISLDGFTYAEYARRGFFELVAVSMLTLALMLWLDYVTIRQQGMQQRVFRGLALGIVALTGVMLWSAHLRLSLYEEVYGYTHLRLYPHVFMGWLAVLYGFFLLMLFRVRPNVFSLGVVICVIGYLGSLNLINVDYTIMRQNIDRYRAGHELDIGYLRNVSEDAIPALLPFYLELPEAAPIRYGIGQWLRREYMVLDGQRGDFSVIEAHAGRDTAWALLNAADDQLPEFDPNYSLPYSDTYADFSR
ncbi:MAG: DUF4173 domain-containing protein [Anaerolineae bacterium]|nr:DUF4173 domain-containing protein [Anaerolineae bacterium]